MYLFKHKQYKKSIAVLTEVRRLWYNQCRGIKNKHMTILTSFIIITLAALVHASFQLSVSVLTLLSGHSLGAQKSHQRTLRLTLSFVTGVGVMTLLILSFMTLAFSSFFTNDASQLMWTIACGLLIGVGVAVWFFYYRKEKGTTLWIPRSFARYLTGRSKTTKDKVEAFSLGLTSVVGELLFIVAPLIVSALVINQLPTAWTPIAIVTYTLISLLSLLVVWVAISSGHRLSAIQKWREDNKRFLQFSAGSALIVLGFFVYVWKVIADTVGILV